VHRRGLQPDSLDIQYEDSLQRQTFELRDACRGQERLGTIASQQQTLAVAEGPLQDMTVTCKQCEVTFVFTKGEQRLFQGKKMKQPARCPECKKRIREKRAETASKNRFQDISSGPKFKTAIVAWAMCEGW